MSPLNKCHHQVVGTVGARTMTVPYQVFNNRECTKQNEFQNCKTEFYSILSSLLAKCLQTAPHFLKKTIVLTKMKPTLNSVFIKHK